MENKTLCTFLENVQFAFAEMKALDESWAYSEYEFSRLQEYEARRELLYRLMDAACAAAAESAALQHSVEARYREETEGFRYSLQDPSQKNFLVSEDLRGDRRAGPCSRYLITRRF